MLFSSAWTSAHSGVAPRDSAKAIRASILHMSDSYGLPLPPDVRHDGLQATRNSYID